MFTSASVSVFFPTFIPLTLPATTFFYNSTHAMKVNIQKNFFGSLKYIIIDFICHINNFIFFHRLQVQEWKLDSVFKTIVIPKAHIIFFPPSFLLGTMVGKKNINYNFKQCIKGWKDKIYLPITTKENIKALFMIESTSSLTTLLSLLMKW